MRDQTNSFRSDISSLKTPHFFTFSCYFATPRKGQFVAPERGIHIAFEFFVLVFVPRYFFVPVLIIVIH